MRQFENLKMATLLVAMLMLVAVAFGQGGGAKCAVCPPSLKGVTTGWVLTDSAGHAVWKVAINGDSTIAWSLTGNSGTNTTANHLGPNDAAGLSIRANSDSNQINLSNAGPPSYTMKLSTRHFDINTTGDATTTFNVDMTPNTTPVVNIVNANFHYTDVNHTEGNGKVLTSDISGNATWQGAIVYDSLTSLTGQTVTLAVGTTVILTALTTITDVTFDFPVGITGDVIEIENAQSITTLNLSGPGSGTITTAKSVNTRTGGLKTFHNYGGNWY